MKEYKDSEEIKRQLRIWIQECEDWLEHKEANCFRDCIDLIDQIPAADVAEVRHGRVMVHDGHEDEYYEYCSECKTMEIHLGDNYCPNCGCKMDRENA